MNQLNINTLHKLFFLGIAGTGMSALAQYLVGIGKKVSGSDRQFSSDTENPTRQKLENEAITCFAQDCSGITADLDAVVVSTAVETTVPEYKRAVELGIPVLMRSDLLAAVARSKKTIAVAGTSGKSTVTAMIFHSLEHAGFKPSLISGAGLTSLERLGKIGNAVAGTGELLVIEVDESDGSLVKYTPEIGVLLNIDKDHKELDELDALFEIFEKNISDKLIVNQNNSRAKKFSQNLKFDFGTSGNEGFFGKNFRQNGFEIQFEINDIPFKINQIGFHNFENALATTAVAAACGVSISQSAEALTTYAGISRRTTLLGTVGGITVIDDYAHNPAKLAAAIRACQTENGRLFVWFQPHGFGPTKFLRQDFVHEISQALRDEDVILMSEIYYAGGTVTKDISAKDLTDDIAKLGKTARFIEDRTHLLSDIYKEIRSGDVLLLTGARDPSLGEFANSVFENLKKHVG